jgi:hypothetical protein
MLERIAKAFRSILDEFSVEFLPAKFVLHEFLRHHLSLLAQPGPDDRCHSAYRGATQCGEHGNNRSVHVPKLTLSHQLGTRMGVGSASPRSQNMRTKTPATAGVFRPRRGPSLK